MPPVTLPADIRSLCSRLATERTRATTWALAADLRQQVRQRLQAGEPVEALVAELRQAVEAAARRQRA